MCFSLCVCVGCVSCVCAGVGVSIPRRAVCMLLLQPQVERAERTVFPWSADRETAGLTPID